jgi:hypothetical protein
VRRNLSGWGRGANGGADAEACFVPMRPDVCTGGGPPRPPSPAPRREGGELRDRSTPSNALRNRHSEGGALADAARAQGWRADEESTRPWHVRLYGLLRRGRTGPWILTDCRAQWCRRRPTAPTPLAPLKRTSHTGGTGGTGEQGHGGTAVLCSLCSSCVSPQCRDFNRSRLPAPIGSSALVLATRSAPRQRWASPRSKSPFPHAVHGRRDGGARRRAGASRNASNLSPDGDPP